MRAFSKEIIEKLKSMPADKKEKVLDGLARLYAVRPYRASEEFIDKGPPAIKIAVEVFPRHD